MSLEKKLEQILESAEYASSEVCTARDSLPDYSANESARSSLENSESYFLSATGDLEDLLEELRKGVK